MGGVVVTIVIAALIWFVMRKRSKKTIEHTLNGELVELHHRDDRDFKKPSELGNQYGVSELAGGQKGDGRPGELWAPHAVIMNPGFAFNLSRNSFNLPPANSKSSKPRYICPLSRTHIEQA